MRLIGAFGIDQAFGKTAIVARVETDKQRQTLFKVISTVPSEHPLEKFYRATYICDQILEFIDEIKRLHINHDWCFSIEGLSHGSFGKAASANRDLAGLQFVVVCELINHFKDYETFITAPKALKKYAVDNGSATKDEMVESIKQRDFNFYEDKLIKIPKSRGRYDVADAFWLAEVAMDKFKEHSNAV